MIFRVKHRKEPTKHGCDVRLRSRRVATDSITYYIVSWTSSGEQEDIVHYKWLVRHVKNCRALNWKVVGIFDRLEAAVGYCQMWA